MNVVRGQIAGIRIDDLISLIKLQLDDYVQKSDNSIHSSWFSCSDIPPLEASKQDVNARKLIITGLAGDVNYAALRDYFSNYGAVDYAGVHDTDAWIVFSDAETATLVLNSQPHFIRGRQIGLRRPDVPSLE